MTNNLNRLRLIQKLLAEIKKIVNHYEHLSYRYKLIDDVTEVLSTSLGALTSTILASDPHNEQLVLAGMTMSGVSAFITVIKRTTKMKESWQKAHTTASHLKGVYRDTLVVLAKNHLTTQDYESLLLSLNHELLLAGSQNPVTNPWNGLRGDSMLTSTNNNNNTNTNVTPLSNTPNPEHPAEV
jgi:hypothetical protein